MRLACPTEAWGILLSPANSLLVSIITVLQRSASRRVASRIIVVYLKEKSKKSGIDEATENEKFYWIHYQPAASVPTFPLPGGPRNRMDFVGSAKRRSEIMAAVPVTCLPGTKQ